MIIRKLYTIQKSGITFLKIKCEKELEKNNITQRIVVTNDYFGAERIGFSYKGVYKSTFLGRAFWCEIAFAVLTQSVEVNYIV